MGNDHVAAAALALTAALAGFLVFNRPPASIFLGDSGSTLIGLVIGVLGIQGNLKSPATLSITAPVVLMTLPMFDVLMAVVRRKLTGRPLALGDREHIHHCLLERGLGPWQVLGILGALCLTTGAAATAATVFRMDALAWIIATTLIVLMIRLRVFGHREFGLIHQFVRRQAGNLAQSLFAVKSSPDLRTDSQACRGGGNSRKEVQGGESVVEGHASGSATGRPEGSLVRRSLGRDPPYAFSPQESAAGPEYRVPRNTGTPGGGQPNRAWSTFRVIASPLPCDLDVGVIYSGERDLMGPLLSTMKASAPGLNYPAGPRRQPLARRHRAVAADHSGNQGAEQQRAAALCGQHEPHPGGLDGPLRPGDEHRHVLRSAAAVPGADGRVHGLPSPTAALPAAACCTPTATTPGPRAASRRCR